MKQIITDEWYQEHTLQIDKAYEAMVEHNENKIVQLVGIEKTIDECTFSPTIQYTLYFEISWYEESE